MMMRKGTSLIVLTAVMVGCTTPTTPELEPEPEPTPCLVFVISQLGDTTTFERDPDTAEEFAAFMRSQTNVRQVWTEGCD